MTDRNQITNLQFQTWTVTPGTLYVPIPALDAT